MSASQPINPCLPPTVAIFNHRFADASSCWAYLVQLRWPTERAPRHPVTGARPVSFRAGSRRWRFADGTEMSAIQGTVMERSHVDLPTWFAAAYAIATHPPGLSARQLARQQRLRYETAFQILHRLRAGLMDQDRQPLQGIIEVAVMPMGGHRHSHQDVPVIAAVEVQAGPRGDVQIGRVRFRVLRQVHARAVLGFLGDQVAPGSVVRTQEQACYRGISAAGYRHQVVAQGKALGRKSVGLRHVQQLLSRVNGWLAHTHGSAVSRQHLQSYVNEAAFRLQHRDVTTAFRAALGIAIRTDAPRYQDIYRVRQRRRGAWTHSNPRRAAS